MKPILKLHCISAAYAAVLISLNWYRSTTYQREVGLTSESTTPVAFATLLSGLLALTLVVLCIRTVRVRVEQGPVVGKGRWIQSWTVILYFLPLLYFHVGSSTWKEPDGAFATSTGGFGHELSFRVFLMAIVGVLLLQVYERLSLKRK